MVLETDVLRLKRHHIGSHTASIFLASSCLLDTCRNMNATDSDIKLLIKWMMGAGNAPALDLVDLAVGSGKIAYQISPLLYFSIRITWPTSFF